MVAKKRRPLSIPTHSLIANMRRSINLDSNLGLHACKINNERTNRMLPPNAHATQRTAPHMRPQDHFCARHGFSKFPTTGKRAAF